MPFYANADVQNDYSTGIIMLAVYSVPGNHTVFHF